MAKTTRWTGTVDGDLTDASNHNNGAPTGTDTWICDGSSSVSVNINAAGLTAQDLAEVNIGAGYSGDLGDSGTPLELSASRFIYKGSGVLYFNNGGTNITDDLWVDAPSGKVVLGDNSSGGGITRIMLLACGDAILASTLDTTNDLFVCSGVHCTIQGSNTIARVWMAPGATVTCTAAITTLYAFGGTWTQLAGGAAIANMFLSPAAVVDYLTDAAITLAVTAPGATLNLNKGPQPKTLTDGFWFPASRVGRIDSSFGTSLRPVPSAG